MVALGLNDRPQDVDVRRVLDLAGGVRRSESEIGDDRVATSGRIDLAVRAAGELLVLADRAERCPFERRRLHARDLDTGDSCFCAFGRSESGHDGEKRNDQRSTPNAGAFLRGP